MELKVTTLEGKSAGSVQLSDEIFGLLPLFDSGDDGANSNLATKINRAFEEFVGTLDRLYRSNEADAYVELLE